MTQTHDVYKAINAVQLALSKTGIAKDRTNTQPGSGYKFRGIDDVYNALAPVLAQHDLIVIPRVLSREQVERKNSKGNALFYVTCQVEFTLICSVDGSSIQAVTYGEAMDSGDKATNKAMSAAYKYMAMQTFCIPTEGDNDADATTHEVAAPDPAVLAQIAACDSKKALRALLNDLPIPVRELHMDAFMARSKEVA